MTSSTHMGQAIQFYVTSWVRNNCKLSREFATPCTPSSTCVESLWCFRASCPKLTTFGSKTQSSRFCWLTGYGKSVVQLTGLSCWRSWKVQMMLKCEVVILDSQSCHQMFWLDAVAQVHPNSFFFVALLWGADRGAIMKLGGEEKGEQIICQIVTSATKSWKREHDDACCSVSHQYSWSWIIHNPLPAS